MASGTVRSFRADPPARSVSAGGASRHMLRWSRSLSFILACLTFGVVATAVFATFLTMGKTLYVSPRGVDADTSGTHDHPYRTIGYALTAATPGTTIAVMPGKYVEYLRTSVSGTRTRPITLKAIGNVRVQGNALKGHLLELTHDYYTIEGFEFTNADSLLWLSEARHNTLVKNWLHEAGGECVRLRYNSRDNLFHQNRVENCGLDGFAEGVSRRNGEGVYIGTAPEQVDRNPTPDVDRSSNNIVRENTFVTNGNECVDIKEGSERNLVEDNSCTGQRDSESGGFNARGNHNEFRFNTSFGNAGAGIRLGGDATTDGIGNVVYNNEFRDNGGYAVKVIRLPQGAICGNIHRNNADGFTNEPSIRDRPCDTPHPRSHPL